MDTELMEAIEQSYIDGRRACNYLKRRLGQDDDESQPPLVIRFDRKRFTYVSAPGKLVDGKREIHQEYKDGHFRQETTPYGVEPHEEFVRHIPSGKILKADVVTDLESRV